MALVINATPGDTAANSYCTLAEAESYHESRLFNDAWTSATSDQKNRALAMATRLLDSLVEWVGAPTTVEQRLQWPRTGLLTPTGDTIEDTEIPEQLKQATAEYALKLLAGDITADGAGVESVSLGDIAVNFATSKANQSRKALPDSVIELVSPWVADTMTNDVAYVELDRA